MDCDTCGGAAHATEAEALLCEEAYDYEAQMEANAEMAAEMAVERWYEDRGWMEALAEREWEDARGVVQFEDAMAAAYAALDAAEARDA